MASLTVAAIGIASFGTAQPDCFDWNTEDYWRFATEEGVAECLSAGADPNARGEDRRTPLHYAAELNENPAVINALLAAGADIHHRTPYGVYSEKPLYGAARHNENPAVIEALLAGGAQVYDSLGPPPHETPLDFAVQNRNPTVMEVLLPAFRAAASFSGFGDYIVQQTVYRAAAYTGNTAVMEVLLAGVGAFTVQEALYRAAAYNENPALIETLIAAGADLNARDEDGETALHHAARYNENPALIEALIAAGADASVRNSSGQRPGNLASANEAIRGSDVYRFLRERARAR